MDWINCWENYETPVGKWEEAAADDLELRSNGVITFSVLSCICFTMHWKKYTVCCKFTQLHSYQILLKLVNIWLDYCENQRVNFFETPCFLFELNSWLLCYRVLFTGAPIVQSSQQKTASKQAVVILYRTKQWVIFLDPWPTWPISQPTRDPCDQLTHFQFRYYYTVSEKKRPEYFSHNFDKFRHNFVIFDTNQPDTSAY